jgi:hypothetical protein
MFGGGEPSSPPLNWFIPAEGDARVSPAGLEA